MCRAWTSSDRVQGGESWWLCAGRHTTTRYAARALLSESISSSHARIEFVSNPRSATSRGQYPSTPPLDVTEGYRVLPTPIRERLSYFTEPRLPVRPAGDHLE